MNLWVKTKDAAEHLVELADGRALHVVDAAGATVAAWAADGLEAVGLLEKLQVAEPPAPAAPVENIDAPPAAPAGLPTEAAVPEPPAPGDPPAPAVPPQDPVA